MVTFLITSVLALGLVAIAIYFWQKPAKTSETIELPPPPVTSLFPSEDPKQLTATAQVDESQATAPVIDSGEPDGKQRLSDEVIDSWRESPDRASTTRLLHAAALSDDADTYRNVVELVLSVWQSEGIPE